MKNVKGIPISKGIVIGSIYKLEEKFIQIEKEMSKSIDDEIEVFNLARNKSIDELKQIEIKVNKDLGEEEAAIFGAHIELLKDFEFVGEVEKEIKKSKCSSAWAVQTVGNRLVAMFENMDNIYFRERAADVKDISQRVLKNIVLGDEKQCELNTPSIIVAKDLTPSETSSLDKEKVLGIISEMGGKTSHSAIIARLLGIPFVIVENAETIFENDQQVILNGKTGDIIINPKEVVIEKYQSEIAKLEEEKEKFGKLKGKLALTSDGIEVNLMANIGTTDDLKYVVKSDAEGIGLFRTEFIFMGKHHLPTEDEQFEIYKEVLESQNGKSVTFRTLDIGGDKENNFFKIPKEMNPFLGLRGIRLCLKEIDVFKSQLKAILRACIYGKGKIMFPMISTIEELIRVKEILEEVKVELSELGVSYNNDVPVGMMMETPSATIRANVFAKEVDFFSIGTNDLIQYTLAVDRMNNSISQLYSQYDPAILTSICHIVNAAKAEAISVSVCGEAAADPLLIPFWVSIGVDKLSMTANAIDEIKWNISNQNGIELKKNNLVWSEFRTREDALRYLNSFK
jgi:phosphotransferase system enzyme I (PtsI)